MERTPLIGNLIRSNQHDEEGQASIGDHPIFLRAAHSPWRFLGQKALGIIRGLVLAYMIATTFLLINYKTKHQKDEHSYWRIPFQFSTVTWFLLLLYHILVFSWTITHKHWPDIDADDTRWTSRLLRLMSPPEQRRDSRRPFYFSLFYTVTHVFALMNVSHYWTVLVPNGHDHWPSKGGNGGGSGGGGSGFFVIFDDCDKNPLKDVVPRGWFPIFCLFNLYVFPAIITLLETTVLNSIRRPEPVPSHLLGTVLSAALYLVYGALGAKATGHSPFFWMDEEELGSNKKVAGYYALFILLALAKFSFLHGLIGMRESVSEGAHSE
ncbi:hypothetical protein VMCG_07050 [Cytospora schulzeri]|uniref:Uncharacterized protein n=1 Tax=Cytospora schulzeri TaxID=448051 RepID=A0A423W3Z8_9PEZI|nr:hypothetical protein VMCG_07050 [Valsa malicola]